MRFALVTGASGFIGRILCEYLKKRDIKVTALLRNPKAGAWDEIIHCDITELSGYPAVNTFLSGIDTVFHLAGIAHTQLPKAIAHQTYWENHVTGTEILLKEAINQGVKRFVYISSVQAMDPQNEYGKSKRAAEELILSMGKQSGLHVCVIRPALVYGKGVKGNIRAMIKAIQQGWFPPIPENGNQRTMISVEDLVDVLLLVAESNIANDKIYTVTDGQIYSTRQLYDGIRKALQLPTRDWSIPDWVLKFVFIHFLKRKTIYDKLLGNAYFDSKLTEIELNWKPTRNFFDSLSEIINKTAIKKRRDLPAFFMFRLKR